MFPPRLELTPRLCSIPCSAAVSTLSWACKRHRSYIHGLGLVRDGTLALAAVRALIMVLIVLLLARRESRRSSEFAFDEVFHFQVAGAETI